MADTPVYPDPMRYWTEYVADFDLEKADRLEDKYDEYEIIRAAISKMRNG